MSYYQTSAKKLDGKFRLGLVSSKCQVRLSLENVRWYLTSKMSNFSVIFAIAKKQKLLTGYKKKVRLILIRQKKTRITSIK